MPGFPAPVGYDLPTGIGTVDDVRRFTAALARASQAETRDGGFDSGTPNMARVYDCWLGGKDHYAADREEAGRLLRIYPRCRPW